MSVASREGGAAFVGQVRGAKHSSVLRVLHPRSPAVSRRPRRDHILQADAFAWMPAFAAVVKVRHPRESGDLEDHRRPEDPHQHEIPAFAGMTNGKASDAIS
jgi:hypothetical protein